MSRIYLGNLPYSATEDDILDFLKLSRTEATVELITDREDPGRKLGFGFVTVPAERASSVLEMDRATMGGRQIKVSPAHDKQQRQRRY